MLVDTSVWVDHFRQQNQELTDALERGEVWSHPFVIGELACGNLKQRPEILTLLEALPQAPLAEHGETLAFVETQRLMGTGLGWVDVHLLASATLAGLTLWTMDRRLAGAAERSGLKPER